MPQIQIKQQKQNLLALSIRIKLPSNFQKLLFLLDNTHLQMFQGHISLVFLLQLGSKSHQDFLKKQTKKLLCEHSGNLENRIIRFYLSCSTYYILVQEQLMYNEPAQEQQKISAFRRLTQQINDYSGLDLLNFANSNDLLQLIVSQNALINSLFQRQRKMEQELQIRMQNQKNSSGSENKETKGSKVYGQRKLTQQEIFNSGSPEEGNPQFNKKSVKIIQKVRHLGPQSKVLKNNEYEDEISSSVFEGQSNSDMRNVKPSFKKKQTQTKNMVKNFAKAIFNYIRKNRDKRDRVLNYLGIKEDEFMTVYNNLKGKVHSILQLRRLWTPEGNIYHKAFRILSNEYLRKNCLEKTFNSRVENYQVHMKYRERLLESLKQPESFTILKTN